MAPWTANYIQVHGCEIDITCPIIMVFSGSAHFCPAFSAVVNHVIYRTTKYCPRFIHPPLHNNIISA